MGWTFTDLPYGWKIATGITLSAITIFVADNIRERINQADEIELDLAIAERCMATQTGTNSDGTPIYAVAPPEYVRSWYSNNYVTTNIPGDLVTNWTAITYTNIYTNAVGYRTDRAKAVARDLTIKALVPYYCDTNTVYDGTTNIVMLTVTGLWEQLQIGDKTNLFTREPEWVGTNGVINAATYGDYPWRIYKEDLEERYKVLNALTKTVSTLHQSTKRKGTSGYQGSWDATKTMTESSYTNNSGWDDYWGDICAVYRGSWGFLSGYGCSIVRSTGYVYSVVYTGLLNRVTFDFMMRAKAYDPFPPTSETFDANGISGLTSNFVWNLLQPSITPASSVLRVTYNSDDALPNEVEGTPTGANLFRGFSFGEVALVGNWNFQYCTNKYW